MPFADRVFKTRSSKVEPVGGLAGQRPVRGDALRLVATKTLRMVNAQILERDVPPASLDVRLVADESLRCSIPPAGEATAPASTSSARLEFLILARERQCMRL